MGQRLVRFSYGASTVLSTAYSAIQLKQQSTLDEYSEPFPSQGRLSHVEIEVTEVSTATELVWFLAWDAAGDRPITPETTSTITMGMTTPTKGGAIAIIGADYFMPEDADRPNRACYLIVKSDAGTPTVEARLYVVW
jgi:hypothetical protein